MRAFAFLRLFGVAQVLFAVSTIWPRVPFPAANAALTGIVVLESLVLVAVCLRRRRISGVSVIADVVFTVTALMVCARLTALPNYNTWANFMYPFSLIEIIIAGVGLRRLASVLALSMLLAVTYAMSARFIHRDPLWNSASNAMSYLANAGVAWLVANTIRKYGVFLDQQRRLAVGRALELARSAEHARAAGLLHDRVLQTLEMLTQAPWISDDRVRGQVVAEASWLRRFVERQQHDDHGGLLEAMHAVCERHLRMGLHLDVNDVEVRTLPLLDRHLDAQAIAALAGAVDEALMNVAKHAKSREATVRIATSDHGVTVSVADGGCGFEPTQYGSGFGQRHSIIARVHNVGGKVTIDSSPGHGTHVQLRVPWSAASADSAQDDMTSASQPG